MRQDAGVDHAHRDVARTDGDVPRGRQIDPAGRLEQVPLVRVVDVVGHEQGIHAQVRLDECDGRIERKPLRERARLGARERARQPDDVRSARHCSPAGKAFARASAELADAPVGVALAGVAQLDDQAVGGITGAGRRRRRRRDADSFAGLGRNERHERERQGESRRGRSSKWKVHGDSRDEGSKRRSLDATVLYKALRRVQTIRTSGHRSPCSMRMRSGS
jgi:hypothetical protein